MQKKRLKCVIEDTMRWNNAGQMGDKFTEMIQNMRQIRQKLPQNKLTKLGSWKIKEIFLEFSFATSEKMQRYGLQLRTLRGWEQCKLMGKSGEVHGLDRWKKCEKGKNWNGKFWQINLSIGGKDKLSSILVIFVLLNYQVASDDTVVVAEKCHKSWNKSDREFFSQILCCYLKWSYMWL